MAKNVKVKQMICRVEIYRRNGCLPKNYKFTFHNGKFGYWVLIKSDWVFRAVHFNKVSLTANQLRN